MQKYSKYLKLYFFQFRFVLFVNYLKETKQRKKLIDVLNLMRNLIINLIKILLHFNCNSGELHNIASIIIKSFNELYNIIKK